MTSRWSVVVLVTLLISNSYVNGQTESPKASDKKGAATTQGASDKKQTAAGIWLGTLTVPGAKLRLAFHLNEKSGKWSGTLDSLDQNARGIPLTGITVTGNKVVIKQTALGMSFEGEMSADGSKLDGTFKQGGGSYPLQLARTDKIEPPKKRNRPQTPKAPFPYETKEVTITNQQAKGVVLGGTLCIPKGEGPFPVVVMITGSGQQDRNETIFQHQPFLVIADHLARNNIASLRCDDRGVGKSKGDLTKATMEDFASDILAMVNYLKESAPANIDKNRIGLVGHSEGGVIAPMVGSKSSDVKFMVLLAGTSVPGKEVLIKQKRLIEEAMGAAADKAEVNQKIHELLLTQVPNAKTKEAVDAVVKQVLELLPKEAQTKAVEASLQDTIKSTQQQLANPWMKHFLGYDPSAMLKQTKVPVLAIFGGKDLQVAPEQNLAPMREAFKQAGNNQVEIVELAGLNHLFQECKTGAPTEYEEIEQTTSPKLLEVLTAWLKKR